MIDKSHVIARIHAPRQRTRFLGIRSVAWKIATFLRNARSPLHSTRSWTVFTRACEGADPRKALGAFLLSTGGVFGANFTGIVRKYWIIDATPARRLTAFKAENPNARKKTKFVCPGHHFSLSLAFSRDRSSATIKFHPGVLQRVRHDLPENWYARSGAIVTWESTWIMKRAISRLTHTDILFLSLSLSLSFRWYRHWSTLADGKRRFHALKESKLIMSVT